MQSQRTKTKSVMLLTLNNNDSKNIINPSPIVHCFYGIVLPVKTVQNANKNFLILLLKLVYTNNALLIKY